MKSFLTDDRKLLAFFWSLIAAGLLVYITVHFGDRVEILTLIIGTLTGTIIGGIFGVYFSANHKQPGSTTEVSTSITKTDNP